MENAKINIVNLSKLNLMLSEIEKLDNKIFPLDKKRREIYINTKLKIKEMQGNSASLHYCPDWDDLLICDLNDEYKLCTCKKK